MDKVLIDTEGSVVRLTFNDPGTLNAMDAQMANEVRDAVKSVADPQNGFRCLLITGAGKGFCSGGSVAWMDSARQEGDAGSRTDHGVTLGTHHHYVLKALRSLPIPIVTAVNGPAAGLGFSYALAGDMVVAARSSFFLSAFRRIGVSPDGGLSWMLPRIVGWARAKELMVMGNRLSAADALDWGLVNRVFDDDVFMDEAMRVARELAEGPTVALGITRQLFWESWSRSYEEQLDQEERLQPCTFATHDAAEGGRAMLEKRKAVFEGR
ncbi:enoyl-CoA hydratase-related protein [Novosphingobium malaysiense]|uniref:Enoyl-CoA hydratase n=1 Tax=Novosphingobium malaysiense TaxID=1348853 RepID=A0A0B1ZSR5_9SPHN|nr:enoyl-CoA hydratase-related protein [Novosphingobium malaysiense]KHK93626.1 hypothetical protein LK12_01400 [Novosphingobium malaysiense]